MSMKISEPTPLPAPVTAPAPVPLPERLREHAADTGRRPVREQDGETVEAVLAVVLNGQAPLPLLATGAGLAAAVSDAPGTVGTRPGLAGKLLHLQVPAPPQGLPSGPALRAPATVAPGRAGYGGAAGTLPALQTPGVPAMQGASAPAALPAAAVAVVGLDATATTASAAAAAANAVNTNAPASHAVQGPAGRHGAQPGAARVTDGPVTPAENRQTDPADDRDAAPRMMGGADAAPRAVPAHAALAAPLSAEQQDGHAPLLREAAQQASRQQGRVRAQQAVQASAQAARNAEAATHLNVAFNSWGAGHAVSVRVDQGRLQLQPSSRQVADALAGALPLGEDATVLPVDARDAAEDRAEQRRRRDRQRAS